MYKGIGASSGIAYAKVLKLNHDDVKITKGKGNPNEELEKVNKAILNNINRLTKIKEGAKGRLSDDELGIFDAHIEITSDPSMLDEIKAIIDSESVNAEYAADQVMTKYVDMFARMDDPYMKERAADIEDVKKNLVKFIMGIEIVDLSAINEKTIIVAYDLTPSETGQLNKEFVVGFATDIGGRTSHSAIMARSLEIPAVLGLNDITSKTNNGDIIAINGDSGDVWLNPSDEQLVELDKKIIAIKEKKEKLKSFIGKKTLTQDGREVELAGNIGTVEDTNKVLENDGEGIGLFRSEFLYMDSHDWPTEEEQFLKYKEVVEKMEGKRVVVRTLDIGGDKKLNYYNFPEELNPFLGYRALRFTMGNKDIFKQQIRALLRASAFGKLAIMFPMVATVQEVKAVIEFININKKELTEEGIEFDSELEIGIMIEIPAAAVLADKLAKYVDFFSIGTNDLMQYTMAADRMNENVSYLYQPLNPSILKLIKLTIDGAHKEGKWVGMCGEMAGDIEVMPILLGLGLDEFSMSSSSILPMREAISKTSFEEAKKIAINAVESETENDVRMLINR